MLLSTHAVEKVWGRKDLAAPFEALPGEMVGEIWFDQAEDLKDLLVKYLFTSAKLSVQVHPSNEQAPTGKNGKEECWYIVDAEPGATIAVGFKRSLTVDEIREGALDGSIENMLEWHTVSAGDFFYLPAGTVHAIGPGLTIAEIQQSSDITYRLYDYGRPRELHLDEALSVVSGEPYPDSLKRSVPKAGEIQLVDGPFFDLWRIDGLPTADLIDRAGPVLLAPLKGSYRTNGQTVPAGGCAFVRNIGSISCDELGQALLIGRSLGAPESN